MPESPPFPGGFPLPLTCPIGRGKLLYIQKEVFTVYFEIPQLRIWAARWQIHFERGKNGQYRRWFTLRWPF
jgi:hypothetical protein